MLNISNLSIHFAGYYLFNNISFSINPNDKIGLIGRNGTGKTTLLRIILGHEHPEEGSISRPSNLTIGYLPQEMTISSNKTIFDETSSALIEIKHLEERIKQVNRIIEQSNNYVSEIYINAVQELSDLNERFRLLGGLSINADIEMVLIGLGFSREDFSRQMSDFSGGWQMRVELAKILLTKPSLILLDEPTNHLDIESIQWLEDYLKNYYGAVIVVSHDRNFLDKVTNRTIELANGKIFDFNVPYSQFITLRQKQKEQIYSAYLNQQKQIKDTERFIERFRYKATLASRVQSRIKQLEKIERIEIEEEDTSNLKFTFPDAMPSGRVVCEVKNLSKYYGSKCVLDNIEFVIERGEKVAFVGKNGEGKSTFSRIIAQKEDYKGSLLMGFNVQIGYYAQNQAEMLDENLTVLETIDSIATGDIRLKIRSLLGAFLFSGDSVYKKVKVLSGGEKSRLAIAKLLLQPVNLLILDEPTSHLDMPAKDVLKQALIDYKGTLILVSHDRDFLNGITSKTYYFRNKKIKCYNGDIYYFLEKHKLENLNEIERNLPKNIESFLVKQEYNKTKLEREEKKKIQREHNRIKRQIEMLEKEISDLEERIKKLGEYFASPEYLYDIKNQNDKKNEFENMTKILSNKIEIWSQLNEQLDKFV